MTDPPTMSGTEKDLPCQVSSVVDTDGENGRVVAHTKRDSSVHKAPPKWLYARRLVQTGCLLLFIAPLLIAGWMPFGITAGSDDSLFTPAELPFFGSLSSSSILGVNTLDPFAGLQTLLATKELNLDILLFCLPVLIVYGLVRGRAFCGWVCPVNYVLEGLDYLRQKLGIRVKEQAISRHTKIVIAGGILLVTAFINIPLFEAISPISFINKGLLFGSTAGLVSFVAIMVTELFWGRRVWCRSLCPVGGLYEVIGRIGLMNVHFDKEACIHCNVCKDRCLVDPVILEPVLTERASVVLAGDCMLCGACIDACPTQALSARPGIEHYTHSKEDK